ncbi:hypothetical protein FC093_17375 [Ilyomonas limi]|uniref:Uncharacterized protein n=1 Tax=Ilyomonas limi TaxID=2575867 RepID=A0A4V6XAT4_9BACT|nr:DUF6119 family protein [Ilyomonas limi]TKK66353.1 hypothetical protein FC093_17375 [Ilyomonas limi]
MKVAARLSKPNVAVKQLLRATSSLTGPIMDWGGIKGSELYHGTSYAGQPSWINFILTGTNSSLPALKNEGAAALLFIPINNRYIMFCFGYSNQHLSGFGIERDFGLRVVLNTVDPSKIKSIDSKIMGSVVMNRRTQLSKENRIEDFGFEVNKDFLRHVAGKPTTSSFASAIAGSDSLNMNCDLNVRNLQTKVTDIYNYYTATNYQTNYSWVDNIKNVKDGFLLPSLDNDLLTSFNNLLSGSPSNLYIACPEVVDYTTLAYFKLTGYRSNTTFGFIEVESLVADLQLKGITSITIKNLENFRIEAFDNDDNFLNSWSLKDWIVYESIISGTQYIFSEGEWFEISSNYFNLVTSSVNSILSHPTEYLSLTPTPHKNEADYIKSYTAQRGHEKIFDRSLSYTYGTTNAIEICDIYNSTKEFIHIKEGSSSNKLSHLFNQGFVSASLLLNDSNFRTDLTSKLKGYTTLLKTIINPINSTKYTVVYRILRNGSAFSLPFFSKIVLIDTHKKIKLMGFKFRLEWVPKI